MELPRSKTREALYSATQLTALQAENERLREDNEELEYRLADEVHAHSMTEDQLTEAAILAKRITAERDDLAKDVLEAIEDGDTQSARHYCERIFDKLKGEKHD